MRAVVFDPSSDRFFSLGTAAAPSLRSPNELLIDVAAISVNFGEVAAPISVSHPGDVPGWDSAGVVRVAAADGSGPQVGARVVGAGWNGGWAQQRVLTSDNVAELPDAVSFEAAAALPVAGATALQAVRRLAPAPGQRVLVTGASGGVGRLAVQLLAATGATVVAAVGHQSRGAGLDGLGAAETVVDIAAVAPIDAVVDLVGGTVADAAALRLRDGGLFLGVGSASGRSADLETAEMTTRRESLTMSWPLGAVLRELVDAVAGGRLRVPVGFSGDWSAFPAVAEALLARRILGKAVLTVSP